MDVLTYPFKFDKSGLASTTPQRSDAHYAQQISQFIQTRPGELPLSPFYGVQDMAFRSVHPTEINAGLSIYHPELGVQDVVIYFSEEGVQTIDVQFVPNYPVSTVAALDGTEGVVIGA